MELTPENRVVDEAMKIDTKVSNIAKMIKIVSSESERAGRSAWHNNKLIGYLYGFGNIYENGKIIKTSRNKCSTDDIKKLTKYRMLGYKNIYLANNEIVYCCVNDNINIVELRKLPKDIQIYLLSCKCNEQNGDIYCGGLYCTRLKPYYRQGIHVKNYVYAIFSDGLALKCKDLKYAYFGGCHNLKVDIKESECYNIRNTTILVNRCVSCTITITNCSNCSIKVAASSYTLLEHKNCTDLDIIDGGDNQYFGVTDEIMNN